MEIITIETPSLGDRSYLLIDGDFAAVFDPQRDIDRIESLLAKRSLRLTHVFETHVHNDYVTGGLELAQRTGATYVLSAEDEVGYEHTGATDADEFVVGQLTVRAMHTPGHTPTHFSYVVIDNHHPVAVFTGGSMLYGTVGRTDLISVESTEALTRAQYRSVRHLSEKLPGNVSVHPTHGFGSFCSSTATSGTEASTIDQEREQNLALTLDDEDVFVERLVGGLTAYPRYYSHMAPINRCGPSPVDLSPPELVEPVEIRRRIHAGEWIVDLRSRKAFARGHLAGTLNFELGNSFVTYLGWMMKWDTPITLVGDTVDEVIEAQRQLLRIGIDRPAGSNDGGLEVWGAGGEVRSFRTVKFNDLASALPNDDIIVLDVRRDDEWAASRIDGAIHIPLPDLERRLGELPDRDVWVHCSSGYRASIAASMLDRAARVAVAIDDDWAAAVAHDKLRIIT